MGIPQKKSRSIIVDERSFRWLALGGKGRYIGSSGGTIHLVVQADSERPGKPMGVWLRHKALDEHPEYLEDPENYHAQMRFGLRPGDVAKAIRHALATGWDPDERGLMHTVKGPLELEDWKVR